MTTEKLDDKKLQFPLECVICRKTVNERKEVTPHSVSTADPRPHEVVGIPANHSLGNRISEEDELDNWRTHLIPGLEEGVYTCSAVCEYNLNAFGIRD